ncbi:tectonic-1 [Anolis carolinensis]|uniref:Tectonic family member 1 n=1 Tax=Anolis carolinensis TaxID=28377 RepID=H9G5T7_ANOCA|nr:PREDICTED: tectonic-1 [Anolis carolinensis]|eukprot:XP_008118080.1 PREDICTED: tectonic-1 [Anolis carolinensis]
MGRGAPPLCLGLLLVFPWPVELSTTPGAPSLEPESSPTSGATPTEEGKPSPGPRPTPEPGPSEPASRLEPWPEPALDVAKLCVCDLLVDECDVNCCCDPLCTAADFSLFTACSVPVVTDDSQLCSWQEARYFLNPDAYPPTRIFQLLDQVNPNVFCIQAINYKDALSFPTPDIPTSDNFDKLLEEFNEDAFDLTLRVQSDARRATDANKTSRYQYKDPILTPAGFLRFPAPLFFSWCTHDNPAAFLVDQDIKCNTAFQGSKCTALPALSMAFYTNLSVLAVPNSSQTVNVTIQSITVQTLGGLRTRLKNTDVLMLPTLHPQSCSNVVLEADYLTTFTEAGEITGVTVSLVLGTINATALFVQQVFGIHFIQQDTQPIPLSGSPGYVVGQPVRAGFRSTGSGVIQSLNEKGQLTILKSSPAQDCLAVEGVRAPVLFGYNMMSGCQLRITKDSNCELLAPAVLTTLKGPNYPDSVASFGDSQPQDGPDWIEIINNFTKSSSCEVPVSFEFQVQWTKYGSLVNPQVKIVCLTTTVLTSALPQVGPGNESTIQVHTFVTFIDVSAPAKPGYKALPSIEASLPFDFFFPFV